MTLFEVLFLAHLVGDFLFQTSWMAMNKATKWIPLLAHVVVYTATITAAAYFFGTGLSLTAIFLVFIGHIILDRRTFVVWWVRNIQQSVDQSAGWLGIVADQIFHLLILAGAIVLSK